MCLQIPLYALTREHPNDTTTTLRTKNDIFTNKSAVELQPSTRLDPTPVRGPPHFGESPRKSPVAMLPPSPR